MSEVEKPKRPRVDKDKFAAQLVKLSDFEVEQVLRIVQEENDRRNMEWIKAQPDYVKPHALKSGEVVTISGSPKLQDALKRLERLEQVEPIVEEIEELD